MSTTIGLDLGGTKLLAGVVDGDGTVVRCERRQIAGLPLPEILDIVEEVFTTLDTDAPLGVGVPAQMDRTRGVAARCVHLPLNGVPIVALLAERLGRPVVVDNDATCAVLAEWRLGVARGLEHVAMLTLGTGIGGGLVLDGRVYRGTLGAGGELGHMPVDLDGPPCFGGCPGNGCLEAMASGKALARAAETVLGYPTTGLEVTQRALDGDRVSRELIAALGTNLGVGCVGLAMALNPQLIVIGGGVIAAGELLLAPARAELRRRGMSPAADVDVVAAQMGDRAGMIGAALLARGADV